MDAHILDTTEFYDGCSDGTFEIVDNWQVKCSLCGQKYRIDKNSLHITVTKQGNGKEHYFFLEEFKCRECGEKLFVRIKVYEDSRGCFIREDHDDLNVDFIIPPRIRVLLSSTAPNSYELTARNRFNGDIANQITEGNQMNDFFFTQKYVDRHFETDSYIDHESISNAFVCDIHAQMDDSRFENLLIISGFIPDLYSSDSSEETLYTKLIEGLVSEWAARIGATGELIKQKASYEDIKITLAGKVIVCDAKSFRLGRSQQAPNAKDFLKLEDIRKWMDRYPTSIGGLVTYPCKHEWTGKSDIYQYCSTKDAPTLMLPYKYLAFLLHYKANYTPDELTALWDYQTLFPHKLTKDIAGGNKNGYWRVINSAICKVTKTTSIQLSEYMQTANQLINQCVAANLGRIQSIRQGIIDRITASIESETDVEAIKRRLIDYQIKTETDQLNKIIQRIKDFR